MTPQTTPTSAPLGEANVLPIAANTNAPAWQAGQPSATPCQPSFDPMPAWLEDDDARHAYMLACLEQDIAWQVRINRERRNWTQAQLARMIGTQQSAIARAEDQAYGRLSIGTLVKIAEAFRCALTLRFVPYEKFVSDIADTSEDALFAPPFERRHK